MSTAVEPVEQGQEETPLLGRARTVFRRTQRDLRDSLAWVARLEETSSRCFIGSTQQIDEGTVDSVVGLLRTVREQYPNQELEVVIFAAPEEARGGVQNGEQDRSAAGRVRRD